jgi:hypothetical protein
VDMTIRGQHHNCTLPAREFPHNHRLAPSRGILAVSPAVSERRLGGLDDAVANMAGIDACYAAAGLPRREATR